MLKTVRVPPRLEPEFAAAEEVVSRFFRSREDDPEHGTIDIFGERYVLVRAASLSVEFFTLVEQLYGPGREGEADRFARNLLFDLAHSVGKSDARNFHAKMRLASPIARLSAGPVHFAHAGWAFVHILPESCPVAGDEFYLIYEHPYSFEADAWRWARQSREFPVCIMSAGYSSGWCEESFGLQLVASEVTCRARSDEACRFIMAPPHAIERRVCAYLEAQKVIGAVAGSYEIPDFFARKRAEDELRSVYERLKELDALKTRLFANVSHELRTPLTIILGVTERLEKTETRSDLRTDLAAIARNARLVLKHVNDLLDVAKLEAGRVQLAYARTDLARLVRLVASYFDVVAADRRVSYAVGVPTSLWADVDADEIQRVLTNLLANAFKFVPDGGMVRCSLSAVDGRAHIAVADSGPGIPPEARELVFERFVDLEPKGAHGFGGTGIGLAIAKELTSLHGGAIGIEDAPEGGALLVVDLPLRAPEGTLVREHAGEAKSEARVRPVLDSLAPPAEPATPPQPESGPLVLVVEDNVEMSNFLTERLATEYRVATAFDGQEGLEKAHALLPDLILTDVMMPRMSGAELVRALRSAAALDNIPILVLTARADDELRVELLGGGAQDYLAKPVLADELLARARRLIAVKRAREILQADLVTKDDDLERLATEAARTKRELSDALGTTRVALEQAERASRAKTTFLSLVSHELRTPLQSVLLNIDALRQQRDTLAARQVEKLDRVERASRRLHELVESLLEMVKQESGRLEVREEVVVLRDVALLVIDDMRPQAVRKSIDLCLVMDDTVSTALTDPSLLRIILVNLINNAIKYTDEGFIEVRIEDGETGHRIAVTDTGHGIPADKLTSIFEPFTRLEPIEKKHIPGFGIGLSLVRTVVRALGGSISVTSEVGRGSSFSVLLPRR